MAVNNLRERRKKRQRWPEFDKRSGAGRQGAGRPRQVLFLPGIASNYASTPDAAALDIVGDLDIRLLVALDDWTPAALQEFLSKDNGTTQRSYQFHIATSGIPAIWWTANGSTTIQKSATAAFGLANGALKWVRVTLDVDNGAVGNDVNFYTSDDGAAWTQLGTTVTTAGVTSVFSGTAEVQVGALTGILQAAGKVYQAQIYNGIGGTLVADLDPNRAAGPSSTTFTDSLGLVWTVNKSGANPATIVYA